MITTTHAILNTALLGRKSNPERNWPVVLGSILPDVPMFLYFFFIVVFRDHFHWFRRYDLNEYHIRLFWVDWAHSIPLALAGVLICRLLKNNWGFFFFVAMGLHDLEDLPVHAEYAHRHFLPFSNWQFFSPISYGDIRHHGAVVAPLEWLEVLICVAILERRDLRLGVQLFLLFVVVFQGLWMVYYFGGVHW
jgi:hypothetical protein